MSRIGEAMGTIRSDLIIETEGLEAGKTLLPNQAKKAMSGVEVKEKWNPDKSMKVTKVQITSKEGETAMGRAKGTYITLELPGLLAEEETLKEIAQEELKLQLEELLRGRKAQYLLVVGLGNREVTADAVGPLAVEQILVTRHFFQEQGLMESIQQKYRCVGAFIPGVMAQTGMETMELIRGVVKETKPDIVIVIDALAAKSPGRLNTTIQLTDTGISPGAGVGNNRKKLNEETLGCPVIAIGVPTVMDALAIVREELEEEVAELFVTPRNIDSSVQFVSELLAEGINRMTIKKTGNV